MFGSKNNVITYKINKEVMKNMYISVQNGEVVVNAPWYLTQHQIQKMVQEKREWILNKLKEFENCNKDEKANNIEHTRKNNIDNKLEIYLLGKKYLMNVKYKNIRISELNVENDEINIILPNKYKKINREQIIKILIDNMYEKIAKREIEVIMEKVRITLGFAPEDYEIKRINKTLGMCLDNKNIVINPDIAKYKREIIEYIIIHEFCHLKYKTHSKKYFELIKKYVPKFDKYDMELNEYRY